MSNQWKQPRFLVVILMYLFVLLVLFSALIVILSSSYVINYGVSIFGNLDFRTILNSILIGGLGGVIYCLRSTYLNVSVRKCWDESYVVWYFVRPIASLIIGGISYLFIKAGLVLFSTAEHYEINQLSIWSLAFLSGLNVDKFLKKLESIGEMLWGIAPSNMSNGTNNTIERGNENG